MRNPDREEESHTLGSFWANTSRTAANRGKTGELPDSRRYNDYNCPDLSKNL